MHVTMHWSVLGQASFEEVVRNSHKVGVHLHGGKVLEDNKAEEGRTGRRWTTLPPCY